MSKSSESRFINTDKRHLSNSFNTFIIVFLLGLLFNFGSPNIVHALESPKGEVLLEIAGNIKITNTGKSASFDRQMLAKLKWVTIKTTTPWTDGVTRFEGVLMRDLLKLVGGTGKFVKAFAINDYMVKIPTEDFEKYDVILALKKNGKVMSVREKGPLWVIYPWDEHKQLRTEIFHARSIWQLKRLVVEKE